MATVVLSAAGAAAGGALGGAFLGVGAAAWGQAIGATAGALIDQKLLGGGSQVVQTGSSASLRIQGADEGAGLPFAAGRIRTTGQIIWSTRYRRHTRRETQGSGKGGGGGSSSVTTETTYYTISFAVALCEGVADRLGRIWADGKLLDQSAHNIRFYSGAEDQPPDDLILLTEGEEATPAFRGTAYLVFENLQVGAFGNRIPQISAEIYRRPEIEGQDSPVDLIRGVALMPGTGEYALASDIVRLNHGLGKSTPVNANNDLGVADMRVSLDTLTAQIPGCDAASLVVSWFGSDLRCDRCKLRPKIEQDQSDSQAMPWVVNGVMRANAQQVSETDGRPSFGGTPADASVRQAIKALQADGKRVMFYPFILMDIPDGNGKTDPWTGVPDQPVFPWRGRITTARGPDQSGTSQETAAADAEIAAFFGNAAPQDFSASGATIAYSGPSEWSYRRFILHYAKLCADVGGVDVFCIGSEMRSLTQIRGADDSYPAVDALIALAADVRSILGPDVKITYAADWSEYFGHHRAGGEVFFHLDPLWADSNIDAVGIDNYMPLSDWRDGLDHADVAAGSVYDLGYLQDNIEGGEGYEWYYHAPEAREHQNRSLISDGAYAEPWVYRYKDLRNWWLNPHHNRPGGERDASATAWVPQSKPFLFTELGCPAVDKGTNQPNVFYDRKSSESALPYHSTGMRDDYIQYRYLQAMLGYWGDASKNPISSVYGAPMVDMSRAYVWAWDLRPWPYFPNRISVWSDGENYGRGHWISGRLEMSPLPDLVRELCARSGVDEIDVTDLHGAVSGLEITRPETVRASLQPLMLAHNIRVFERGDQLVFENLNAKAEIDLRDVDYAVAEGETIGAFERIREDARENPSRVRVKFLNVDQDYQTGSVEAILPGAEQAAAQTSDLPMAMSRADAQLIADRALSLGRIAQEAGRCSLPPSLAALEPGDLVRLGDAKDSDLYRVDRIEEQGARALELQRVEQGVLSPPRYRDEFADTRVEVTPGPLHVEFLDLPLLSGDEVPHAPHIAVYADPWGGDASVYASASDDGYSLNVTLSSASIIGETVTELGQAAPSRWQWGAGLEVDIGGEELLSRSAQDVLNGANAAALSTGDGIWEVFQFQTAELTENGTYILDGLMRGQAGTYADMPAQWPLGTRFVLLNGAPTQIDLAQSARGLTRHYRVGPSSKAYDHSSYTYYERAFDGIGLRPYPPVHLRAARDGAGDLQASWIRCTRIDGDSWQGGEVPLGEETESYTLTIEKDGVQIAQHDLSTPQFTYSAAQQSADGVAAPFDISVAQISARFGAGPATRITVHV